MRVFPDPELIKRLAEQAVRQKAQLDRDRARRFVWEEGDLKILDKLPDNLIRPVPPKKKPSAAAKADDDDNESGDLGAVVTPELLGHMRSVVEWYDRYPERIGKSEAGGEAEPDEWRLGSILKASDKARYTFSLVYKASEPEAPVEDAHGEFATEAGLREAQWDYVSAGDRSIYVQHGLVPGLGYRRAGQWVDLVCWPYPVETELLLPDEATGKLEKGGPQAIPAGSLFMGIRWEPWAWELVKAGKIRGLSFAGRAKRTQEY